ncbi:MAG: hypothetical protein B6U75_00145 [Desulfurococcales archaeon ex4484_217_1]|nr:MAG: hypothetical protein B6U75_00145 [Desulfurococcales archaeon ex4484_217_1]
MNRQSSRKSVKVHIDFTKYPFLIQPTQYFNIKYNVKLGFIEILKTMDIEKLKRRVRERILGAIKGKIPDPFGVSDDEEIAAYYLSIIVLSIINDKWLIRRYAVAEAERIRKYLVSESNDVLSVIANTLGILLDNIEQRPLRIPYFISKGIIYDVKYVFRVHVKDYLKSIRLHSDLSWKLVNQIVSEGFVYLTREKVIRYLVEIITNIIERQVKPLTKEEVPSLIKEILSDVEVEVQKIRKEHAQYALYASMREKFDELRSLGIIVFEAFPPCIKALYQDALDGKHLSHHARFALATFLLNIGLDVNSVVNVFRKLPDFDETIAKYQVEHLAGLRGSRKKYKPYNCDTMRTLGLCIEECNVKNPLVKYYRNVLKIKRA